MAERGVGELHVNDMVVQFGTLRALDGVSLKVGRGEIVGLLGPNGAGKTTLFNSILGTVPIRSGEVTYDGGRTTGLSPMAMFARGVTRTFQIPEVVTEMTVLENVLIGCQHLSKTSPFIQALRVPVYRRRERRAHGRALEALEALELRDRAHELVSSLSLGTVRLVEVARCLAAEPKLLLLDEVVSGLTPQEMDPLAVVLRRLVAETSASVLLVEHNVRWALNTVDRVYVLNSGQMLTHGPPDEVRNNPEVIAAYLGSHHA